MIRCTVTVKLFSGLVTDSVNLEPDTTRQEVLLTIALDSYTKQCFVLSLQKRLLHKVNKNTVFSIDSQSGHSKALDWKTQTYPYAWESPVKTDS